MHPLPSKPSSCAYENAASHLAWQDDQNRHLYSSLSRDDCNLSLVERKILEIIQTLKLAKKTSKDDYFQHLRLVALGLGAVGGIAFLIKLASTFINLGLGGRG